MRNHTVKIAKYAYLDTDINRTKEQIHLILQPKKYSTKKITFLLHLLFIILILLAFSATEKFYHEKISVLWDKITNKLMIAQINIYGNSKILNEEILSTTDFALPISITDLDLKNIREGILKNSLIKNVEIKINLPDRLNIHVIERKPAALWFHQGTFHLIDEEGFVVKSNVTPQEYQQIIAAGPDSNKALHSLLDELKEQKILNQLFAAQLISNRRWNILLKNGLIIKLPENNIQKALVALDVVLKNYKSAKSFNIIDLRLAPDKVYAIF